MRLVALIAAVTAAATLMYARLRRRYIRWGASEEEVQKSLPGDELVPQAKVQSTRAVTIEAPPEQVWPWLVQIGYGRGGFYSYDLLENLATRLAGMRAHYKSADRILPEFQNLREGDFIPSAPQDWRGGRYAGKLGWTVKRLEKPRVLALENWGAFVLEPLEGGRTRLIVRTRGGRTWKDKLMYLPWELPHFIMERRMLLGIKARAEAAAARSRTARAPAGVTP